MTVIRLSQPAIPDEGIAAVARVLRSGQLVQGVEAAAFEEELAEYLGCGQTVLVSSGTAALHLALLALDIGPGDAVLVPDFTFPATANVVVLSGARPVVVDVEPGTYTMAVEAVAQRLDSWTGPEKIRAVLPVQEFGQCADMAGLCALTAAHDLHLLEDAACALGATYRGEKAGTFGSIGCFSFHPRKSLTTGEGGALSVADPAVAARLRRLRNQGIQRSTRGAEVEEVGLNYRLTDFQAALGRSQLGGLDASIRQRRSLAGAYASRLAPLEASGRLTLPVMTEGHSCQTYMVVLDERQDRDLVIDRLRSAGVETNIGAHSLSSLGLYGPQAGSFPEGSRLYRHGLALPMHEHLTTEDVEYVGDRLEQVLADGPTS